jgi:hypothetical protein
MPPSKKIKSTTRKRRTARIFHDSNPEVGPKRQSRLQVADDEYVEATIRSTGISEAALLRNLVNKGIRLERLERAGRDPVVNTLLDTVEDLLSAHLDKLERRLSAELHTLRRLTATTIVLSNASMRLLEAYVATEPPADQKALAERRKAFFNRLYQQYIAESEKIMEGMLEERETVLTTLANSDLITPLKDADLETALDSPEGSTEGEK